MNQSNSPYPKASTYFIVISNTAHTAILCFLGVTSLTIWNFSKRTCKQKLQLAVQINSNFKPNEINVIPEFYVI